MKKHLAILALLLSCTSCDQLVHNDTRYPGCGVTATPDTLQYSKEAKALFTANCAACHHPVKDATGPALQGSLLRCPDSAWLKAFVKNSQQMIKRGDKYSADLFTKWNKTEMPSFEQLTDKEYNLLLEYMK